MGLSDTCRFCLELLLKCRHPLQRRFGTQPLADSTHLGEQDSSLIVSPFRHSQFGDFQQRQGAFKGRLARLSQLQ